MLPSEVGEWYDIANVLIIYLIIIILPLIRIRFIMYFTCIKCILHLQLGQVYWRGLIATGYPLSNGAILYTLYIIILYMLNSSLNMFSSKAFTPSFPKTKSIFSSRLTDSHLGSQSPWLPLDPKDLLLHPLGE